LCSHTGFDTHIERLATKDDLRLLGADLRGEIGTVAEKFNHMKWMLGLIAGGVIAITLRVYFPVS
jgi:hypothetical protein